MRWFSTCENTLAVKYLVWQSGVKTPRRYCEGSWYIFPSHFDWSAVWECMGVSAWSGGVQRIFWGNMGNPMHAYRKSRKLRRRYVLWEKSWSIKKNKKTTMQKQYNARGERKYENAIKRENAKIKKKDTARSKKGHREFHKRTRGWR